MIEAGPAVRATPPSRDRIDWRQFRALARLLLLTAVRTTVDQTTGARGRSVLVPLTFFGVVTGCTFVLPAMFYANVRSFLPGVFVSAFLQAAFSAAPATIDVRQRSLDLIHTRPVGDLTLHLASAFTVV